jgi:hypothetical protein
LFSKKWAAPSVKNRGNFSPQPPSR